MRFINPGFSSLLDKAVEARDKRQAVYVQRNTEARSCNHCCSGKERNITYSECVSVALVIRHALRMRRTVLSSVNYLAVPVFHITS